MENKKDIRFILIFIIIVSISFTYLFQTAYAKYRKQIEGNTESTIAGWNIKVNNETINNKTVLTNYITPVYDSNQYVKANVLAPGSTGYFDVVINASEVDVDFTYVMSGTVNEQTPLNDLIITEYEQDGVTYDYDEEDMITGDIQKNSGNTSIRVYFKWDDGENETMNNQQDTTYAIDPHNHSTKIKVSINFEQKK